MESGSTLRCLLYAAVAGFAANILAAPKEVVLYNLNNDKHPDAVVQDYFGRREIFIGADNGKSVPLDSTTIPEQYQDNIRTAVENSMDKAFPSNPKKTLSKLVELCRSKTQSK